MKRQFSFLVTPLVQYLNKSRRTRRCSKNNLKHYHITFAHFILAKENAHSNQNLPKFPEPLELSTEKLATRCGKWKLSLWLIETSHSVFIYSLRDKTTISNINSTLNRAFYSSESG